MCPHTHVPDQTSGPSMPVTLILGCMYSGKSEALLQAISAAAACADGARPLVLVSSVCHRPTAAAAAAGASDDDDVHTTIRSRSPVTPKAYSALAVDSLVDVLTSLSFGDPRPIFVDEAQFFADMCDAVDIALTKNLHLTLAALDTTFQGFLFPSVEDTLRVFGTEAKFTIRYLTATCAVCRARAVRSARCPDPDTVTVTPRGPPSLIVLDTGNNYAPLCFPCFNKYKDTTPDEALKFWHTCQPQVAVVVAGATETDVENTKE